MRECDGCGARSWSAIPNGMRCDYCGGRVVRWWEPVAHEVPPLDHSPGAINGRPPGLDRLRERFEPAGPFFPRTRWLT